MLVFNIIGTILVVVGAVLSIQKVSEKIGLKSKVGWILAFIGMVILAFCGFIGGEIFFPIVCLAFAIGNIYCFVND